MKTHILALAFSVAFFSSVAFAGSGMTADQILKKVQNNLQSKDDSAHVKMIITEPDGSKKERDLDISRKTASNGQSVLVRLLSPADLRDTGLLSINKGGKSDQWLYLPSSKQTRRILSSKRSSNFLDSELSYEDMGATGDTKVVNRVLRTEGGSGGPFAVIESQIDNPDSAYSRILTWVSTKTYLVNHIEYYDRSGKLLKTTKMNNYKHFPNGIWRAQKVLVQNVQKNRGTELDLLDLKLDQGLSDDDFSPSALENP